MNNLPKITILTLCYNNAPAVIETLKSVRNQKYSNIEHLILDDCSPNNAFSVLEEWIKNNNYNCKLYKNDVNKGICASLNTLIKKATGELIACNCDDLWDDNHLSDNIDLLIKNQADVLYSNVAVIDENHNFQFHYQDVLDYNGYPNKSDLIFDAHNSYKILDNKKAIEALFYTNFLHPITMITYKKHIERVGYYDEKLPFEDYDMNFRLCKDLKIIYNSQSTSQYIKQATSFTVAPHRKIQLNEGIINTLLKHTALLTSSNAQQRFDAAIYNACKTIIELRPNLIIPYSKVLIKNLTNKGLYLKFILAYSKVILRNNLKKY
jgi:glycosyltransferase involved in cell wall biosynthesis